ncbi:MAG: crossover junction endodeoxyribonuclease RuvC [Proteobacteria bacterium]|nr:crossover junction endodeoxyribonuclease RuvC [Pseudomonadota bacterium]
MTRIIGIDPGSQITGYGIIEMDSNRAIHVAHGMIKVQGSTLGEKLHLIFVEVGKIISAHRPDEAAIERVFMHRNADSALKLGQARGAAMIAFVEHGLDVFEYTANQVKQATVGKGHAAKQQVQHMVKILLCLQKIPQADAADALAIALCHGHSREGLLRMNGVTGIKGGRLQ